MKKRPEAKRKWVIPLVIVVVLLLGVLGYAGYYFYAFTQLEIRDVAVGSITDFSLKGFSFRGYIDIYNPNLISVTIKHIEYGVVFEPTSQLLSKGVLAGGKLPANAITRIQFNKSINWAPALSLIVQLVTNKEPANIIFSGQVFVTEKIKLPFVYKLDVRSYFEQFVQEKKQEVVDQAVETVEERYGKIAGDIVKRIAGYFN